MGFFSDFLDVLQGDIVVDDGFMAPGPLDGLADDDTSTSQQYMSAGCRQGTWNGGSLCWACEQDDMDDEL